MKKDKQLTMEMGNLVDIEKFPEVPVSALDMMLKGQQMWRGQQLFDDLIEKKDYKNAEKIAKFMERTFGIELAVD